MNDDTMNIDKAAQSLDAIPADDVQVYKLIKPVSVGGMLYTELKLNFDSLTSVDMEAIDSDLDKPSLREFSKTYQLHVVARAAKVPIEVIRALGLKDATQVTLRALSFLTTTAD